MTQSPSRLWTVDEYHRMAETGILGGRNESSLSKAHCTKRVQKKPPHSAVTQRCQLSEETLTELAYIRVQEPIHLSSYSEPEPDIAVADSR